MQKLVQGDVGADPLLQLVLECVQCPSLPDIGWDSVVVHCAPVAKTSMAQSTSGIKFFPKSKTPTSSLPGAVGMVSAEPIAQMVWLA